MNVLHYKIPLFQRANDTKPKAPAGRNTKNSQPITTFFKVDNPKPTTRQRKKPASSKKSKESAHDDDDDEEDNDGDDSEDSDFIEVKTTRGKKRAAPSKVESKSKKTKTVPAQSKLNNKRTSKRAANSSQAKPAKRRPTKRTVNKKNTSDIDSEEDIVDHELENELFLKV